MTQPATVNVAGRPVRKVYLYGGGAVAAVVVGVWYWRKRQAANATAAVDTSGTAQLDTSTGSVGDTGFQNPVPGAVGNGGTVDTTGGTAIQDNAAWTQAVLQKFADMGSIYDPLFAAQTLGKYLAGQDLTQDEANLVRAAWAIEGQPPQGAPPITLVQTGSTPGGGSGTPTPPPTDGGGGTPPAPPVTSPPTTPVSTSPSRLRRYVITVHFSEPNPDWRSTLSGIGGHYGEDYHTLAAWNGISNPNVIGTGVRIYIDPPTPPGGGSWTGALRVA